MNHTQANLVGFGALRRATEVILKFDLAKRSIWCTINLRKKSVGILKITLRLEFKNPLVLPIAK